ncbi:S9 family peptidase [Pedobacter africanus]|uniref:Dipeptidyl aminopeptidase/acylaminoacyl peptidase n=1 Tax=Pedobacter africanus TaxID=151894 RepID=A0A1W2CUG6_9SPHI|nr:prolyl oligopeptidase family serine peptidase [Pedobacter africanus]SMC88879.1 Dipeptidyl aminopeptidase/acylaminoacyl peptidase [Pedobacter africanus]
MQAIKPRYKSYFWAYLSLIYLFVSSTNLYGQVYKKRLLTPGEYPLWGYLVPDKISDKANWVSYRSWYEHTGEDTLVVQQTYGHKKYVFAGSESGKFNGDTDFACMKSDTLTLVELKSGKSLKIPHAANFAFSGNQKFLIVLLKQTDQKFTLEIRDRTGSVVEKVLDIAQYRFEPSENGIVYCVAKNNVYSAEFILFKDLASRKTFTTNHKAPFKNFVWSGNSIAFIEALTEGFEIFVYHLLQDKLNRLDQKKATGFPAEMKISDGRFKNLMISKNGEKVFFWLKENQIKSNLIDPKAVQVWNAGDKQLFGSKKLLGDYVMSDKLAVWDLKHNSVLQLTDKDRPSGFLSADYNYAFTYDKNAYEPQTRQIGAYDLYLVNLKNGEKKSIIDRYTLGDYIPSRSPDGRYLCYAKQGHWWIYDIQTDLHTNITTSLHNSFFVEYTNIPQEDAPYGIGGWTTKGEVILYDRYDLWKISLDGKVKVRLTKGREIQKTYRVKFDSRIYNAGAESNMYTLDPNKGLLLTTSDRDIGATGISYLSSRLGPKDLLWENKKLHQVSKAEHMDTFMYLEESFSSPPKLMLYDGKTKEIAGSNKHQDQYHWGKSERIEYFVNGIKTKGVLFYPAGYQSGRKYPMVVNIYERQFAYIHDYENPTLINGAGNNVTNFTLQGYFVLYPDINYEFGNLKESVTKSVLSAVDAVIVKGDVQPDKIGLIGHSFGGYETDLIITQTDRFAAAVAGAAWTDLVSAYLYFGQETMRPDFFRFEDQQMRIGKSLYEDMESYLKNSPVLLADKVKTPLLGWAGKDDATINSLQSMEFFLALRRANKEHILLVYPEDGHQLEKKENAADLSERIMQWFDYYLKGGEKQDWMNKN